MSNRLYVTNIAYGATASDLGKLFERIGPVTNAAIAESEGKPLGFGFVVLADETAARLACEQLNNAPLLNRPIRVQIARQNNGGREGGGREGGGREGGFRGGRGGYDRDGGSGFRGGRGGYDRDGGNYGGRGGYNRDGGNYGRSYNNRDEGNYRGGNGSYNNRDEGWQNRGEGRNDREGGGYQRRGGFDRDGGGYGRGRGGYYRGGDFGGRGGWRGGRGGRGGFRQRTPIDESTPRSETQIYVGNLAWVTTVEELKAAFADFGVKEVTIPHNRFGRALGFGLVDFETSQGQQDALKRGKFPLHDRDVVMSAAIVRPPREDNKDQDASAPKDK